MAIDLDLHFDCPGGSEIYYGHMTDAACDGVLDVDMGVG